MKKKMLAILLAVSVMAVTFTGCGEKAVEETGQVNAEVSVEASAESGEDVSMEASAEAGSEANAETSSEASSEAGLEAKTEGNDWSAAYDTYFDENPLMHNNSQMSTSVEEQGLTMKMVTAVSDNKFMISFDLGVASMDIYGVDGKMYAKTVAEGEESWVYASVESKEDTEGVTDMGSTVKDEDILSWEYVEAVEEDGVVYDVLNVVIQGDDDEEDKDAKCYVNRETQKVDKLIVVDEESGLEAVMVFEDIEGIELPAEAANATETTAEEISMGLFGVFMTAAFSSMEAQ